MLVSNLLKLCDVCLIQEYWLLNEQRHDLNIDNEFILCGVSDMDSSVLLHGCPFGGCAIVFRKSLAGSINMLRTDSNCFCAVMLTDSHGSRILLINVYLPTDYVTSDSHSDYLHSLGELDGFIDTQNFDHLVFARDINADFRRQGLHVQALKSFMDDNDLLAADLAYQQSVQYAYVRDHSSVTSWLDHVLCYDSLVPRISNVARRDYGSTLFRSPPCWLYT